MALSGDGVLPSINHEFAAFLDELNDTLVHTDEVAEPRNAVLDERVSHARASRYSTPRAAGDRDGLRLWHETHARYLTTRVALPWVGKAAPEYLTGATDCAETFHAGAGNETSIGDQLFLLHLVRFPHERHVSIGYTTFAEALRRVGTSAMADADDIRLVDAGLREWSSAGVRDLSPQWACLWIEARELFGAAPSDDEPNWPRRLCNRLGLKWGSPTGNAGFEFVVFRYRYRDLPVAEWSNGRPLLAVPSVLDGWPYPYFCPAPRGEASGRAVNFEGVGDAPNREYIHPPIRHSAAAVFRVGLLQDEFDFDLEDARRAHLDCVRAISGRADYGTRTDP